MSLMLKPSPAVRELAASLRLACRRADTPERLAIVAEHCRNAGDLLEGLDTPLLAGSSDTYQRHLAYADPDGAFCMLFLVWRQGQFSPVHGHHAWCAYKVLGGRMTERHYALRDTQHGARQTGEVARLPGTVVTASAGITQIHQLGNADAAPAVSLHIYGVAEAAVSCGVNRVIAA